MSDSLLRYDDRLSEHSLKQILDRWLKAQGWTTHIAWYKIRGIDIEAHRANERWIIEVKGMGTRNAMRVNYFLAVLAETLQRMSDPAVKYSIALPDLPQFRRLWARLPMLAKRRTCISAIFVDKTAMFAPTTNCYHYAIQNSDSLCYNCSKAGIRQCG